MNRLRTAAEILGMAPLPVVVALAAAPEDMAAPDDITGMSIAVEVVVASPPSVATSTDMDTVEVVTLIPTLGVGELAVSMTRV